MSESLPIKVVLLGETAVGKSCILSRFANDTYSSNHMSTLAAYFCTKNVFYDKVNREIKYEIWDTAGEERYRSISKMFYQDTSVVILVLDITRKETFEAIKNYWYSEVKNSTNEDIIIAIAANKSDLYEYEEVDKKELEDYAQSINAIYKETSAVNNTGISELFDNIGYKLLDPRKYKESIKKTASKKKIKQKSIDNHPNNIEKDNENDNASFKIKKPKHQKKQQENCC